MQGTAWVYKGRPVTEDEVETMRFSDAQIAAVGKMARMEYRRQKREASRARRAQRAVKAKAALGLA